MSHSAAPPSWTQRVTGSGWLLPVVLAVPGLLVVMRALLGTWGDDLFYASMHTSGEYSVRTLVLALMATPLQRIWPKRKAVKWLRRNRRAFGVAAFGYGALHLAFYLLHCWGGVIDDLAHWTYLAGWVALGLMVPLAATSFDAAVKRMGMVRWRQLHRAAYVVAAASALHWILKPEGDVVLPTLLHFGPLVALEIHRLRSRRK